MSVKFKRTVAVLALIMSMPSVTTAAVIASFQIFNNLYNQANANPGSSASSVTFKFYNSGATPTLCDTVTLAFRTGATELVGTGAGIKCAAVTSVTVTAGPSSVNPAYQPYNTTPVTITGYTQAYYQHAIIIQDLGTGTPPAGPAAVDGSIPPVFYVTNGAPNTQGTLGFVLKESLFQE